METLTSSDKPALSGLSQLPNYAAMINEVEQRLHVNTQKIEAASQLASTETPASQPPLPDYDAISGKLDSALRRDQWQCNVEGRYLAVMFLIEVVFARLAVLTDHVRFASNSDAGCKLEIFAQSRANLVAYADALARFGLVTDNKLAHLTTPAELQSSLDPDLLVIAKRTVAADTYEEQIQRFEKGISKDDCASLRNHEVNLAKLLELRHVHMAEVVNEVCLRVDNMLCIDHQVAEKAAKEQRQRETVGALRKLRKNVAMAVLAGLTLLAPMLIMVLHPDLLTALATTSVFVLVVAVLLALLMADAERKDIVAATAAYAAVLVVFVGTSGSSTSDGSSQNSSLSKGEVGGIVVGCIAGTLVLLAGANIVWLKLALVFPTWVPPPLPGDRERRKADLKGYVAEIEDSRWLTDSE